MIKKKKYKRKTSQYISSPYKEIGIKSTHSLFTCGGMKAVEQENSKILKQTGFGVK